VATVGVARQTGVSPPPFRRGTGDARDPPRSSFFLVCLSMIVFCVPFLEVASGVVGAWNKGEYVYDGGGRRLSPYCGQGISSVSRRADRGGGRQEKGWGPVPSRFVCYAGDVLLQGTA